MAEPAGRISEAEFAELRRENEQLRRENEQLRRENEQLRNELHGVRGEIDRLKGLPETPRRPPQRSMLNDEHGPPSARRDTKTARRGKRPGSAKRAKTAQLKIHETVPLRLENLLPGTKPLGYTDFTVQDLTIQAHNTLYRRGRYQLPDGTLYTVPLPDEVTSHFGPTLRSYVLYEHYHNHVTQPLLLEELREFGLDISAGTINDLLTVGHDAFHAEKAQLLSAAREVSSYFHTDDTSARHRGHNGHTLHIGNELFASFFTTETKSRAHFLKILRSPFDDYRLDGDALFYLEYYDAPQGLRSRLAAVVAESDTVCQGDAAWERQLDAWEITAPEHRRLVTEAALFGSLLAHDLYLHHTLISDDASQFHVLGLLHGLCWVHAERHVARLIPLTPQEHRAYDRVRDEIWNYYQQLKRYRESPTAHARARLEREFDRLFQQQTEFPELNETLRKLHAKKENLLLVLEHPEIPLHNNPSEHDIRQYVKKRKISAGTRRPLLKPVVLQTSQQRDLELISVPTGPRVPGETEAIEATARALAKRCLLGNPDWDGAIKFYCIAIVERRARRSANADQALEKAGLAMLIGNVAFVPTTSVRSVSTCAQQLLVGVGQSKTGSANRTRERVGTLTTVASRRSIAK